MTVTEEELQRIVARAVKVALGEILDDEPKVGIFWYDPRHNDLFGVRSHRVSDYLKANSRSEFGSIFYDPDTEVFTIAVGSWIGQYPQAVELIVDEFNLRQTQYEVKSARHWDIGQKWM